MSVTRARETSKASLSFLVSLPSAILHPKVKPTSYTCAPNSTKQPIIPAVRTHDENFQ
ncbi:hypothetical protein L873DRAFT_1808436 [Choiromyces venosus 120613-1]|uniref:Uncharacterized protein n=1 Tax=Choiromyces venosus 120613-1 TaxID=1336337 RepID=A0A3N4JJK0_9PEZI|nr:hypothetical protein L873DRAFT_1808436 [Choiromyces venosus 120613-1]